MVNVPPCRSSSFNFPSRALRGEIGDVALQIGKTFFIRIAHDRHHQSAFGPNRDADVVEVVLNEIVAVDSAIDDRHGFERFHGRFDEERHEARV